MIAQKMVDAKHSQEPGHTPIALPNLVAPASWTLSSEHPGSLLSVWVLVSRDAKASALLPLPLWTIGPGRIDGGPLCGQARS
jgi:hypothetical protein